MGNQKSKHNSNKKPIKDIESNKKSNLLTSLTLTQYNGKSFERKLENNLESITELEISSQDDFEKCIEYCKQIPNLQILHFKYSSLNDDKIDKIITLVNDKKLSYLNLMNNKITQVGAKKLFDSLARNETIGVLNLMHNQICHHETLFDFLKHNHCLRILGISGNKLSLSTKENLLKNLRSNYTLCDITMDSNDLETRYLNESIRQALLENKSSKPLKILILLIRRDKKSILSILPRRLVIYMFKFF